MLLQTPSPLFKAEDIRGGMGFYLKEANKRKMKKFVIRDKPSLAAVGTAVSTVASRGLLPAPGRAMPLAKPPGPPRGGPSTSGLGLQEGEQSQGRGGGFLAPAPGLLAGPSTSGDRSAALRRRCAGGAKPPPSGAPSLSPPPAPPPAPPGDAPPRRGSHPPRAPPTQA